MGHDATTARCLFCSRSTFQAPFRACSTPTGTKLHSSAPMIRQRRSRRAGSGFRIEKPIRRPHATTLPAALSKLRHDPLDKPACPPQRCASCQGSGKAVDPGAREIATSGLLRVPKKNREAPFDLDYHIGVEPPAGRSQGQNARASRKRRRSRPPAGSLYKTKRG